MVEWRLVERKRVTEWRLAERKILDQCIDSVEEDEPAYVHQCYDCGNRTKPGHSVETKFSLCRDWESGIVDDVECDECGTCNTGPEGEGEPECEKCGLCNWWCCGKAKCTECYEWFDAPEEPDDSICKKCS